MASSAQLEVLTEHQMKVLKDSEAHVEGLAADFSSLLAGGGSVDTPADVAQRMLDSYEAVNWDKLIAVLEYLKYPTSAGYGATGSPRCPECTNSLQHGKPHGSPHLRCCADCKTIFRLPCAETLVEAVHGPLETSKGESLSVEQVVQILNNLRLGDHPDDAPPEKFITESAVWFSTLHPWCLQWHPKSYKQYIQDFLDGKLNVDDYNFCIERVKDQKYVWSYIMGEGSSQMLTRRLFPSEESLMVCYNRLGVKRVIQGVG